jgi:hypothetical protein
MQLKLLIAPHDQRLENIKRFRKKYIVTAPTTPPLSNAGGQLSEEEASKRFVDDKMPATREPLIAEEKKDSTERCRLIIGIIISVVLLVVIVIFSVMK